MLQEFFHPEELMQMVVGCQDYDFRELEQVTEERNYVQYSVLSTRIMPRLRTGRRK